MKSMLITAFCLVTILPVAYARDDKDTLKREVELKEVVVKAAPMINKADRKLIMPTETQMKSSANAVELVSKLNLPGVIVNPVEQSISLASAGKVDLRINGRAVDVKELRAVDPKTIVRVEYHDNPSLRYGEAEAVIDFIVKNPTSGGSAGVSLMPSVNKGWHHYNGYVKLNNKKSEFSFNSSTRLQWDLGQWRDNTEFYTRSDGSSFNRTETGEVMGAECNSYWNQLSYSFNDPDKQMFYASIGMEYVDFAHNDFGGVLENGDTGTKFRMKDLNSSDGYNPSLDLYWQRNLKNNQLLMLNVVTSYNYDKSRRDYTEYMLTDGVESEFPSTDITTVVNSKTWQVVAEADYEKTWKNRRFTAGVKHTRSWSESEYPVYDLMSRMRKNNTYMFAELWQRVAGKLDLTLGFGATHSHTNAVGERTTSAWVFHPKLNVRWRMNDRNTLRLSFNTYGSNPTISQLTNVEQAIDNNQVSVGNTALKTYTTYNTVLQYEYTKGVFYGRFLGNYTYRHRPIMECKFWGDDNIISTYANHKNAQVLGSELTLRINQLKNWVSVSASGGLRRYIMHGNDYTHTYNNWWYRGDVQVTHWNWGLMLGVQNGRNQFWGESLTGGESMHVMGISYRYKDFHFQTMALNPFANNYKRDSENRNRYAGYKRTSYIKSAERLIVVGVSWNIQWGRKHKGGQKRIDNSGSGESVKAAGKG